MFDAITNVSSELLGTDGLFGDIVYQVGQLISGIAGLFTGELN